MVEKDRKLLNRGSIEILPVVGGQQGTMTSKQNGTTKRVCGKKTNSMITKLPGLSDLIKKFLGGSFSERMRAHTSW